MGRFPISLGSGVEDFRLDGSARLPARQSLGREKLFT